MYKIQLPSRLYSLKYHFSLKKHFLKIKKYILPSCLYFLTNKKYLKPPNKCILGTLWENPVFIIHLGTSQNFIIGVDKRIFIMYIESVR